MPLPRFHDVRFARVHAPAKGHPVFILYGSTLEEPCYVLKKENFRSFFGAGVYENPWKGANTRASAPRGSDTAKHMAVGLRTLDEMRRSFEFVSATYGACTRRFPEFRVLDAFEVANALRRLQGANTDGELFDAQFVEQQRGSEEVASSFWTLIDCLHGLYDWKGLVEKKLPAAEPAAVAAVRFLKHNPDITRDLGRIVALDCFFGNNDRTTWGYDYNARSWQWSALNMGNYFLLLTGLDGQCIFSGIDFFDPNSNVMNLFGDFAVQDGDELSPWPGKAFLNAKVAAIRPHAAALVESLDGYMSSKGHGTTLGAAHVDALARGFVEGSAALKKYLAGETGKPPGVKARKRRLGW